MVRDIRLQWTVWIFRDIQFLHHVNICNERITVLETITSEFQNAEARSGERITQGPPMSLLREELVSFGLIMRGNSTWQVDFYYRPQRSCGKVMFSQASVILFTGGRAWLGGVHGRGGMRGRGHVWQGGHAWQGACMAGGHAWQGHVWQRACVAGCAWWGCAWQGCAWQGGMCGWGMHGGGHAWQGACVAGETATAADGMHPTGTHSCYQLSTV